MSLNNPISIIIHATGNIKGYYLPVETFTLLSVPATYILFILGFPAYSTYITMIIAAIAAHFVRLNRLKKYYNPFRYSEYIKSFLIPAFVITIITYSFAFLIHTSIIDSLLRISAIIFMSVTCVTSFVILIGLSKTEKDILKRLIISLKRKLIGI